jgi:glycosyltransferase involved in cell wall biosynthesis
MPLVSVVIPCYNQGQFIEDAVASVAIQSFDDLEIIIVNDGSSDSFTNELLAGYDRDRVRVIATDNRGLAAARNTGIGAAAGRYILPLDADDTINQGYIEKAVSILEENPEIGIVYCQATLFGAVETDWELPDYSLQRMLIDNIIFCSAFFRRDDWLAVGGYDEGMIYGWEDYSLWLSLIERGRKVHQIQERLFRYRVSSDSMVRSKEKWQKVEMLKRIYLRHQTIFSDNIEVWINAILDSRDFYYTSRLYVDCGLGISDEGGISRKIEQGTRKIVFDLDKYSDIIALRFDPVDTFAVVELEKVAVRYKTGSEVRVDRIQCNELYAHDGKLFFDTIDPQCYFTGLGPPELKDIAQLTVSLRFVALAESALKYLVDYQKALIDDLRGQKLSMKINRAGRSMVRLAPGSKKK